MLAIALLGLTAGCRSSQSPSQSAVTPGINSSSPVASLNPLAGVERSLIFAPTQYPKGNWNPPNLVFEDAWFSAADGTRLHGWYLPHERPRAVVLYCHGNAGNLSDWTDVLQILHDRVGVAIMIFDYRGFGRSQGTPSEAGVLSDARAARAWLANRAGIQQNEIVLLGRSLGGAVAVDLAAADGAPALVLESTFTSLPDVGHSLFPLLPVRTLMQSQFNSLAKISRYRGPLLQSHGNADRLIPYEIGRRLFDAANQPKRFVTLPGRNHNDPQTDEYYEILVEFLGRTARPAFGRGEPRWRHR